MEKEEKKNKKENKGLKHLEEENHKLKNDLNKKNIKLTTLEFDLLVLLIKNKSKCFSREEILDKVWGSDYFGTDRVVDDLIRRLRKKLDKLNVEAVYGYGYRLS